MTIALRSLCCLVLLSLAACGGDAPPPAAVADAPEAPSNTYGDPASPVAGNVLGTAIHTQDVEELRYVILKALTDRYAQAKGLAVTPAETEAYVTNVREALSKDPATAGTLGEDSAEDRAARIEIANAFIIQWKIDRALHEQYGGRIGFQQGGPEPLDAYRMFLEEGQAAGDFTISDAALATEFWNYYRDDARHTFFKPGSPEEAAAFAVPPWAPRK